MKIRINWAFGITLVVLAFVVFILDLVYRCSCERVDLVSEKYYENELRYEERIGSVRNVSESGNRIAMEMNGRVLNIGYPVAMACSNISGTISFFRPDDSRLDFDVKVDPSSDNTQSVSLASLKRGKWKVQVTWRSKEMPFYQEQEIWLN